MLRKFLIVPLLFLPVLAIFITPAQTSAAKRSRTTYISTASSGVTVIPYVRADKYALILDFEDFSGVVNVYYNLNYTNIDNGILGGVEGSFVPSKSLYSGYYNGKPYIRRELLFGTCSKNVCNLHRVKDVKVTVVTKMKNGKQYSKIISLPNDQF